MKLKWIYECENVDGDALSNLYKIAPLGDKKVEEHLSDEAVEELFKVGSHH